LDQLETGYENFHLIFMLKLARYLGFGVQNINEIIGGKIVDKETENILAELLRAEYDSPLKISNMQRRIVLDLLVKFYHEHMEQLGEIRSLQVLREVFM
ncbi:MAG TPA: DNA repair protein RecO, partial [Chryseosolibacter sp.]|nr:DNA repair protein RecO [Chryseosolibacter sp.]